MLTDHDQIEVADAIADMLMRSEQAGACWDFDEIDHAVCELRRITSYDPDVACPSTIDDVVSVLNRLFRAVPGTSDN